MTLSKQLLILISVIFLTIFGVNYVISIKNIRSYLQNESQVHAQGAATSLGLSLSPYILKESDPILKSMIGAIFDMGYYKEIRLDNADDKTLVKLTNDKVFAEVPSWLIHLLPMEPATAQSEISSGWTFGGSVYVTVNPGYAYLKLYQQAKSTFYYSLAAFLLSICLLVFVLRFTLKPLKNINDLALAIADGQFDKIAHLPWATEVKNVAHSMNLMSRKLNGVMINLNEKLLALGPKLQLDSLSGLYNKSTFDSDLKQLYLEHADGYLFLIKTDSLASLVKERGSDTIDAFLQNCAAQLKQTAQNFSSEAIAYHFYGAEFAVLARNIQPPQARKLAKSLSMTLSELGHVHHRDDIGHIGAVAIDPLGAAEDMLPAAHEAYEHAVIIGPNSYFIRTGDDRAKDIAEWKSLVFDVVTRNSYKIQFTDPITHIADNRIVMEEAFIQAFDKQGGSIPVGIFVSIAEKYEKIIALDQGMIRKVIEHLIGAPSSSNIAVNLSTRTIKNSAFRVWFTKQIEQYASISPQLIISFSAYAAAKDFNTYYEFISFLRTFGIRVVLKRFDSQSMPLNNLKTLKPDFVRLSRELSNDLQGDAEKISFLQTVKEIGDLLDISILAENIHSDIDFDIVKNIGLTGASR
ncbi:LapD/MoxY N-terminal periplasmic domain-containing protein [Methylomicrobium sp. Wu6]|uniref:bifunctional diguanylate cyclase/phosphodiesterase n=1 Tax=Methylomicrobium sp. Wu6 TaxID=3107928 RepID=UPI002DD62279|nr:LapD/MoxY N-terminal periplasmic domain-containing protein [Methylomicrobium sp. Wu6]MEC4747387.1 LapD/MoxY N-terminal periplasmic domain-containing protein [Methylomicrobium sp. Wu6]